MQVTFHQLLQQLPTRSEIPGLLEDISKIGISSGLEFKLIKPLPEERHDFYSELPIKIIVSGSYHQLADFVSQVSALGRIVNLSDFTIKQYQATAANKNHYTELTDKLEMDITAKTFRYSEIDDKAYSDNTKGSRP